MKSGVPLAFDALISGLELLICDSFRISIYIKSTSFTNILARIGHVFFLH
jgi:hypothetical protein